MQWLRQRIHLGWVGGAIVAMTLAYFATGGSPTILVHNAATDVDVPTIPVVTQPPRPVIPPVDTAGPNIDEPDAPEPPDVSGAIDDAHDQADQAREDAEEQAEQSREDAEEQRADAEEQAEDARRDAEQQKADAQRQADAERAAHPH
jgi:type IV secretory pathway VirB10-like protein